MPWLLLRHLQAMNSNLNVFLLVGQSNMAGRGRLDDVPSLQHAEVSMFRNGQ
jgi:hypothetical protein